MIKTLHKMGIRSSFLYTCGIASIGLSFAAWASSLALETTKGIDRADRWGIFVGQWAPTFFALGSGLHVEELRQELMEQRQIPEREREPVRAPAGAYGS
ncbi:hypothetical protein [Nonomuraea sp. SYSU D8015]|uniref:hypothetical protein n=1 Tax=Nonomuraea sp. SYSU D8015 TaxID=2593644 RepID=UPI0016603BFD|nr:hypothetical protein [Nonomuraea sp. SYSU D8015]